MAMTNEASDDALLMPVLSDGVVSLRARSLDDVDAMTQMCQDPEFSRWTTVPVPFARSDAEEFVTEISPAGWRDRTSYGWSIDLLDEGVPRFAGTIDIRSTPRPDIGYGLHPWARGRSAMTRAVRLATRWAFDEVGMPVVHWITHKGNLDSWRVAWACGFTFGAELPAYAPQRGELRDAWTASLRPGDETRPNSPWYDPPVLTDGRVRLRAHTPADLPRIVEACTDPTTRHWLSALPAPYTLDAARDYVTTCRLQESLGRAVTWAVADPDTDRLLANLTLFRLADRDCPSGAEVGYWAHPDARGRGVVSAAVELALEHAFTPVDAGGLGRHRVQLGASWTNAASRQVAERTGFTEVGHFRLDGLVGADPERRTYDDGVWYDRLATDRG